ncbi:S-layer homology domain-containing protein [Paenibacillus allorhizoplanae]|nr:S-layer homology domain-containing protein [Paenibacillus allorhizoplanae]
MSRLKGYEGMKLLSRLKHIKLVSMVVVLTMILSSISVSATEQKAFADARVITVKQDGTGDFKFINDAAQAAQPGDTVLIYSGTYRETVAAPRGGSNENTRITYKAAPGQQVIIKGSELAQDWSFDNASQTWMKTLPNLYFGSFNPFDTHWAKGTLPGSKQLRTAGSVYLNDSLLTERSALSEVQTTPLTWTAKVDSVTTTVYANFGVDPNANIVELTKRKQVFTASWNTGYITVDGLTIMHGAGTKDIDYWRPAAIPMEGALSTNGGYNWIIQNSVLKNNGGVALDFGLGSAMNEAKYGTPAKYGYHIIRNNIIKDNNTNGAFAYKGPFTEIYNNKFINNNALNTGLLSEAYLKIIDNGTGANIHDNYFYSNQSWMSFPVWLDSEVQNYKFSRNVIVASNPDSVFFDEANFGSNVIDNNVFIGSGASFLETQGTSLVHNMFINSNVSFDATHFPGFPGAQVQGADVDGYRHMMLYRPGTLVPLGTVATRTKYNKVLNNIFYNIGMITFPSFIDDKPFIEPAILDAATTNLWGNEVDYNVNYNGAAKILDYTSNSYTPDTHSAEISGNPASASCDENKCTITFSVDAANTPANLGAHKITGAYIGKNHVLATMPDSIFKLPDGNKPDGVAHIGPSPIDNYIEDVTTDFYGNTRTGNTVAAGPFRNIQPGSNTLVVWSSDAALKEPILSGPVHFADMESHWAKKEINDLASRLIVNGIDESAFEPDRPITRSEFATIVVRALGLNGSSSVSTFSDIASTDWFKDFVNQAYQYGIVSGYPDGSFAPTASVTREEAMSMIARAMKVINSAFGMDESETDVLLSSFTDKAHVSEWAKQNMALLVKSGLIEGEAGTLQPGRSMTRAETAVIVERMLIQAGIVGTALQK